MAGNRNFYEVLGVPESASQEEIRNAYRRLAVKYHPDKNPGDTQAEERFKELGTAYDVLNDPGKRARYDQQLQMGFPPEGVPTGGPQGGFESISIDEILRRYGSIFGDLFGGEGLGEEGGPEGRFGRRGPRGRRGEDVEASVAVPFRQAALGETIQVTLHDSRGARTLSVRLPEGAADGSTLRLKGQGGLGHGGAPAGDLFLRVRVEPDPVFRLRGRDIEADLPVPAPIAVLGGKVTVTTIRGQEGTVTIPAGTSSGTVLRLRGQGVRGGDHRARVVVTVPRMPTDEQRELYDRLRALEHAPA